MDISFYMKNLKYDEYTKIIDSGMLHEEQRKILENKLQYCVPDESQIPKEDQKFVRMFRLNLMHQYEFPEWDEDEDITSEEESEEEIITTSCSSPRILKLSMKSKYLFKPSPQVSINNEIVEEAKITATEILKSKKVRLSAVEEFMLKMISAKEQFERGMDQLLGNLKKIP